MPRLRTRWWVVGLGVFALLAGLMLAIAVGVESRPTELLWHRTYIPGGMRPARFPSNEVSQFGSDSLIEHGIVGSPAIYDFDGKPRWTFAAAEPDEGARSTALGADGSVYVGTNHNHVYAFDASGTQRWEADTPGDREWMCCPAASANGVVYVASSDGVLYSLTSTGRVNWRKEIQGLSGRSAPLVGPDGTVYASSKSLELLAIDPDGNIKWRTPAGSVSLELLLSPSGLIISCRPSKGFVRAFHADGSQAWEFSFQSGSPTITPLIGNNGTLYLSTKLGSHDMLTAVSANGQQEWSFPLSGGFDRASLDSGGAIWLVSDLVSAAFPYAQKNSVLYKPSTAISNQLYKGGLIDMARITVLSPSGHVTNRQQAPFHACATDPIPLADGSVALLSMDGELYCFRR